MNHYIEITKFDTKYNEIDLDIKKLNRYKTPLIICTNDKQYIRLTNSLVNKEATIYRWWDLITSPYFKNKTTTDEWYKHDIIVFLDPNRSGNRYLYTQLINTIKLL